MAATDRLLSIDEVLRLTGEPRSTWYDRMKRGTAPQRVRVGANVGWRSPDVDAYLAGKREWGRTEPPAEHPHFRAVPDLPNCQRAQALLRRLRLYGYFEAQVQPTTGTRHAVLVPVGTKPAADAARDLAIFFPDLVFQLCGHDGRPVGGTGQPGEWLR